MTRLKIAMIAAGLVLGLSTAHAQSGGPGAWDADAAAAYLDQRVDWWSGWEPAARERGTFCVSCHTTGPYGLARPMLRPTARAGEASRPERALLEADTSRKRRAEVIDHVAAGYILQGMLDRMQHMRLAP